MFFFFPLILSQLCNIGSLLSHFPNIKHLKILEKRSQMMKDLPHSLLVIAQDETD